MITSLSRAGKSQPRARESRRPQKLHLLRYCFELVKRQAIKPREAFLLARVDAAVNNLRRRGQRFLDSLKTRKEIIEEVVCSERPLLVEWKATPDEMAAFLGCGRDALDNIRRSLQRRELLEVKPKKGRPWLWRVPIRDKEKSALAIPWSIYERFQSGEIGAMPMLLLAQINRQLESTNKYNWSNARLGEEFGRDEATIKRWFAALKSAGIIRVECGDDWRRVERGSKWTAIKVPEPVPSENGNGHVHIHIPEEGAVSRNIFEEAEPEVDEEGFKIQPSSCRCRVEDAEAQL